MSSSSTRTSTVLTVATVTALGGLVAYAVYFDYRRRNDSEFRKKLRKEKKKASKQTEQAKVTAATDGGLEGVTPADLKEALSKIKSEELPPSPGEREAYFMMQLQVADQLVAKGHNLGGAMAYFRAMRVYPAPVELMMMLQQTAPEPVFKIFMELVNADVSPNSPEKPHEEAAEEAENSPTRSSPPSETSSQEWDRLTDPGIQAAS